MANQITVGRNPQTTIVVGARYNTVSGNHATITCNNNTLTLEDHSTNGTYVNGQKFHNSSVVIRLGDNVTLGKQYSLNLNEVMRYFGGGEKTERIPEIPGTALDPQSYTPQQNSTPKCLDKWSWGAFLWGWLWGVCNGVYWPLVTLIPYIGSVAALIICFVLGANGNKYAWEKFKGTAEEFDNKQHKWNVAAGIYAIILVLAIIMYIITLN